ncbi:LytS/YhcK type 5TM receptor domain-containing protein [Geobacter sp. SVR]|uniref:LytS/YhcK type 5TM receptor domain-containing protein n=1 Tax=Geobacter sp. SVR TaxID=2495594 RepID=UPI00143F044A|nr:LytS/YhcK type 5TM receptor domain-containing protein [Geobacter sp. SVR]BCS53508.1 histidine kinase [Geobacter sp. SVR]GCF84295.1 histidine kinase [Geobacter sp. SVR]
MDNQIVSLSLDLFERLGLLAIVFFLMMRFELCRRLLTGTANGWEKLIYAVYFGLAGVLANYYAFPVQGAIANLRGVPVAMGGILGGPLVGLAAGLIAGSHRFFVDIGGLTSLACGIGTLLEGVVAALVYRSLQRKQYDAAVAFLTGVVIESIKMGMILLLARPFDSALAAVEAIALPTILSNAFGIAILVEVLASVTREQERLMAQQAQITLSIASSTLPYLRHGLTHESAVRTAQIIRDMTGLAAVSLYGENEILAHEGRGPGQSTGDGPAAIVQRVRESGSLTIAATREEIGYPGQPGEFGSAIAAPLKKWDKTVGVMVLYRVEEKGVTRLDVELAGGLAPLFSSQLELGEIETQRKLVAEAEIKALQAQINPHFLFNAISTIISYTRTDPQTASCLLVKLAEFFRKNISPSGDRVDLATELEHCDAYVAIEKARFEERLAVVYEVDEETLSCKVPSLILQPLVENGIRHGILPKEGGGVIHVGAHRTGDTVNIYVRDNGVGMAPERIAQLLVPGPGPRSEGGLGLALRNVNGRLAALYGKENSLHISSEPGKGTTVRFCIPVIP